MNSESAMAPSSLILFRRRVSYSINCKSFLSNLLNTMIYSSSKSWSQTSMHNGFMILQHLMAESKHYEIRALGSNLTSFIRFGPELFLGFGFKTCKIFWFNFASATNFWDLSEKLPPSVLSQLISHKVMFRSLTRLFIYSMVVVVRREHSPKLNFSSLSFYIIR